LGITPSSEQRKSSGKPRAGLPKDKRQRRLQEKERLLHQISRSDKLNAWYRDLARRHRGKAKRLSERLMKLEEIELTPEDPRRRPEAPAANQAEAGDAN
jgi:hypothetical protein